MKKLISILLAVSFLTGFALAESSKQTSPKSNPAQTQAQNAKKQKREWAKFDRYASANSNLKKSPVAVFMGDSITEGWARQRPEFFAANNFAGRGISGQTSSEMLVRFRNDVIALKPKAVAILAGTNDIAENNGPIKLENVLSNIVSMAELGRLHKIKVILCSVMPAYDFPWRKGLEPAPKVKKLNAMIRDYAAKNGFVYVDYYAKLVDERGGLPEKYSRDGVHLKNEAYAIIEPIIKAEILKR